MVKAYPRYKKSDVSWIGEVPDHWDVLSLGRVLKERKEKNNPIKTDNILSLSLSRGVIPYADKDPGGNKAKEDLSAYMLAYPGDIVLNSMNVVVGSVGLSKYFGAVSPVYYMLRPRNEKDVVEYFDSIFRNVVFQRSLFGLGNGIMYVESKTSGKLNTIRLRIPMSKLKRVSLPYPSSEEQVAIARFVAWMDKRIQSYTKAKQRVIKLINEQKQAIVNRAITRGLNPNGKFKSSGVNWLGDIPEHWKVRRLKFLLSGSLKYGANEASGNLNPDDPRYVRITDIDSDGNLRDETFCSIPQEVAKDYLLHEGDILFARSGATVGKTFCYQGSWGTAAYAGYLIRARINPAIANYRFVYHFTRSGVYSQWILSSFIKATIQNISAEKYASLWIPLPPLDEQKEIVNFIERQHKPFDEAINHMKIAVDRIKEFRNRLIGDVVTGKVDVRDVKLPDLVEETLQEPIDEEEISEDVEDSEEVVNADE